MTGKGLSGIGRPPSRFDPTARDDFPILRRCRRHDRKEARRLLVAAERPDLITDRAAILDLAHRLDYQSRGEPPPHSRASHVHMGEHQMHIGGAIWQLIADTQAAGQAVTFATLAPRKGDIRPCQIGHLDPRRMGRQLHSDLDRVIQSKQLCRTGWSILFAECEYQQAEGVFRFHWHGFATGGELAALDGLRKLRKYRSPKPEPGEERDPVRFRVRLSREPLINVGYLSRYPLKFEWRARSVPSNQPGNRDRTWPAPLPEELRVIERLFYDRWRIQDIAVVRGLRVINGRLTETRRVRG